MWLFFSGQSSWVLWCSVYDTVLSFLPSHRRCSCGSLSTQSISDLSLLSLAIIAHGIVLICIVFGSPVLKYVAALMPGCYVKSIVALWLDRAANWRFHGNRCLVLCESMGGVGAVEVAVCSQLTVWLVRLDVFMIGGLCDVVLIERTGIESCRYAFLLIQKQCWNSWF